MEKKQFPHQRTKAALLAAGALLAAATVGCSSEAAPAHPLDACASREPIAGKPVSKLDTADVDQVLAIVKQDNKDAFEDQGNDTWAANLRATTEINAHGGRTAMTVIVLAQKAHPKVGDVTAVQAVTSQKVAGKAESILKVSSVHFDTEGAHYETTLFKQNTGHTYQQYTYTADNSGNACGYNAKENVNNKLSIWPRRYLEHMPADAKTIANYAMSDIVLAAGASQHITPGIMEWQDVDVSASFNHQFDHTPFQPAWTVAP
jgi:hypothetical protein